DDQPCPRLPELSGNYRNPCPGFTETRVRELLKSVSGNLRNPHWENDPAMNFPKAIKIHSRRYWREDEIDEWLEQKKEG
ncbi:MAG: hypothetical protein WBO29_04360, partial [Albidovulum sp.]